MTTTDIDRQINAALLQASASLAEAARLMANRPTQQTPAERPDQLLTIAEVSERIKVSPHTLRSWRAERRGPKAARLGGRLVYRADDLQAWLEEQYDAPSLVGARARYVGAVGPVQRGS